MDNKHLYSIFGLNADASDQEVKSAYRKLSMRYHPDRHPNAVGYKEIFQKLVVAYEILSDRQKRKDYDEYGASYFDLNDDDFAGTQIAEYKQTTSISSEKRFWSNLDPDFYFSHGQVGEERVELTKSVLSEFIDQLVDFEPDFGEVFTFLQATGDGFFEVVVDPEREGCPFFIRLNGVIPTRTLLEELIALGWLQEKIGSRSGEIVLEGDEFWFKTNGAELLWSSMQLLCESTHPNNGYVDWHFFTEEKSSAGWMIILAIAVFIASVTYFSGWFDSVEEYSVENTYLSALSDEDVFRELIVQCQNCESDVNAANKLAYLFYEGVGTKRDLFQAAKYLVIAQNIEFDSRREETLIRITQEYLSKIGYKNVLVDGEWGRSSQLALRDAALNNHCDLREEVVGREGPVIGFFKRMFRASYREKVASFDWGDNETFYYKLSRC